MLLEAMLYWWLSSYILLQSVQLVIAFIHGNNLASQALEAEVESLAC
jgi:hypothetical protein